MKIALLLLLVGLTAGLTLPDSREPSRQESQEEKPADEAQAPEDEFANLAPFARYRALEKQRLLEELEGAWILTDHRNELEGPSEDVRQGFMLFSKGFATIFVHAQTVESGFLGSSEKSYAQAGSFRFRISDELLLQTASMMGFQSGDDDEIVLTGSGEGREYEISLADGELELFNTTEEIRMTLRQVQATDFPEAALEDLELQRLEPR